MKKTHDIVATAGEYKTRDGETKKRYVNCGAVFIDDKDRMSIKLDTIPVTPDWSGWLSLYPIDNNRERRPQQQPRSEAQERHNRAKADGYAPEPGKPYRDPLEDEPNIPF